MSPGRSLVGGAVEVSPRGRQHRPVANGPDVGRRELSDECSEHSVLHCGAVSDRKPDASEAALRDRKCASGFEPGLPPPCPDRQAASSVHHTISRRTDLHVTHLTTVRGTAPRTVASTPEDRASLDGHQQSAAGLPNVPVIRIVGLYRCRGLVMKPFLVVATSWTVRDRPDAALDPVTTSESRWLPAVGTRRSWAAASVRLGSPLITMATADCWGREMDVHVTPIGVLSRIDDTVRDYRPVTSPGTAGGSVARRTSSNHY